CRLFVCAVMRGPPRSPLFPYTTLFRSRLYGGAVSGYQRQHESLFRRLRPAAFGGAIFLQQERPNDPRRARSGRFREDPAGSGSRSEEHTSELQSREKLVCRLLLEKKI